MPGESRTSPRRIQAKLRQRQALELRLAERTYDEIAQALGYRHRSGAEMAVQAALRDITRQPAEEVKSIYLGRLNAMVKALWPKVVAGDVQAIATGLRVLERLAAYLGLDAPRRLSVDMERTVRALALELGAPMEVVVRHMIILIKELDADAQARAGVLPEPAIIDAAVAPEEHSESP